MIETVFQNNHMRNGTLPNWEETSMNSAESYSDSVDKKVSRMHQKSAKSLCSSRIHQKALEGARINEVLRYQSYYYPRPIEAIQRIESNKLRLARRNEARTSQQMNSKKKVQRPENTEILDRTTNISVATKE